MYHFYLIKAPTGITACSSKSSPGGHAGEKKKGGMHWDRGGWRIASLLVMETQITLNL